MSDTRVMPGVHDYTGSKIATLDVGRMTRRSPEPAYDTVCRQCGARGQSVSQRQLREGSARCKAAGCGKASVPNRRELLQEQRRIAAERQAEAERTAAEASAARMEAETADYSRPERYRPEPTPREMTQRERDSLREFKAAEEQAQREADAPRIAAERAAAEHVEQLRSEQEETLRQLRAVERERVLNLPDDEFHIDPATAVPEAHVPTEQLAAWHAAQSTQFLSDNPQYFRCPENQAAIMGYIKRNAPNLVLLSAKQMSDAYRRLRELGLLKERPAPVVKPTPEPVEHRVERKPAPKPTNPLDEVVDGWEIDGSAPRKWTGRELERLSADDYRRAMRLYKADLELPNVGPGPSVRTR